MRLGNEMGGVAAIDNVWGRRLLLILLAVALVAAGLFLAAPAAQADFGDEHVEASIDVSCDGGGYATITVENHSDTYTMYVDSVAIGEDGDEPFDELADGEAVDAEDSEDYFPDGALDDGDYYVDVSVYWASEESDDAYEEFSVECEGPQTEFDCDEDDCSNITDPFGGNWTADIDCDGCSVLLRDPGSDVADIEVFTDDPFMILLTTTGKGTPPGRASVGFDKAGDGTFESNLPKCTGKNPTDCVKIKRIKHARTQYKVIYDTDPRFRFR